MKVYILEIGKYWDVAEVTRVFATKKSARRNIPKGFKEIKIPGHFYYSENKESEPEKWLTIKPYEVET